MANASYEMSDALREIFERRKKVEDDGKFKVNSKTLGSLEIGKSYFIKNDECSFPDDLERALANYRSICSRYSKDGKAYGVARHEAGFEIGRFE